MFAGGVGRRRQPHDELTKQEVDPRPLQDEQLHSQADELTDERRLMLVRSLAALLPDAQCQVVRGILAGASRDELAAALKT